MFLIVFFTQFWTKKREYGPYENQEQTVLIPKFISAQQEFQSCSQCFQWEYSDQDQRGQGHQFDVDNVQWPKLDKHNT